MTKTQITNYRVRQKWSAEEVEEDEDKVVAQLIDSSVDRKGGVWKGLHRINQLQNKVHLLYYIVLNYIL